MLIPWITLHRSLLNLGLVCGVIASFGTSARGANEILTKSDAFEIMKKSGFKWKETALLDDDAQSKLDLAASQFYPIVSGNIREFSGRLNPIQYGVGDTTSFTWFTAGQSAVQIYYDIYSRSNYDRSNGADWYQKKNVARRESFRNDLTFLMLSQYLNVQRLKKKLSVSENGSNRGEKLKEIARDRLASGMGVKLDVLHAQTLAEYDMIKKLELQTSYDKALHLLAMTLGQELVEQELESLEFIDFPIPEENAEKIASQIQSRYDIQSSRFLYQVHRELTRSISHERLPKVSLLADLGVLGAASVFGLGKEFNGTVGLQISFPIFNLSLAARESQSRAQMTKVEIEADSAEFEAKSEIRQAIKQMIQTKKTLEVSTHQLSVAEEELKMSSEKYSAGSMSGFEFSSARSAYLDAQNANIEVVYMFELSKAYYFKTIAQFDDYFYLERKARKKAHRHG